MIQSGIKNGIISLLFRNQCGKTWPMKKLQPRETMFISEGEAKKILEPHFPAFRRIMYAAWAEWELISSEQRAKLLARARANCLYDFIVHHAKVHFDKVKGVEPFERRGLFLLGFYGLLTIRFKKLGRGKRSSNIQTQQQIDFNLQIDLPGIPKAVRLTIGYVLDIPQTRIKDVLVTLQTGSQLAWHFPIQEANPVVVALPVSGTQTVRRAKVRAKKPIEKTTE